jgi:competence protein ComEC
LLAALLLIGVGAVVVVALGHLSSIRQRAEIALGQGMPSREAELARGFVLGEDDRIDPVTSEDFRRSSLSHLLAVSGQNVALLGLLAMPLLAFLGIPFRARLVWVLALIACYVPLAGAGPSIQRAGVMGGLSILAALAGRRASRFYALVLALIATLAIDPGIAADVGWQLSFAAVLGILVLAAPLREAIPLRSAGRHPLARLLCEGIAMTLAATLATAPLIAFHFERLSITALPANLLVLPAVAPAMWLGMLAAAAGQLPGFPTELINLLNAPLLAYIAQVAAWFGRPGWAAVQVHLNEEELAASYVALALATFLALRLLRRIASARRGRARRHALPRLTAVRSACLAAFFLAGLSLIPSGETAAAPPAALRVSVLDVGQGDAILLQPAGAAPILVDGGPPGQRLAAMLHAAGADELGAVVLTHDQTDHAGGIEELLGRFPIARFLYAVVDRDTLLEAHRAGVPMERISEGDVLSSGGLRLNVVWPPAELLTASGVDDDPNRLALVMVARWRDFSMLLSADAEAEATPLDPGPIDVLKVAHHGSDDAGLGALLDRTRPRLAVISVGTENSYGHPTIGTLGILASHGVRVLRTDRDGTVVLDVDRRSIGVERGS